MRLVGSCVVIAVATVFLALMFYICYMLIMEKAFWVAIVALIFTLIYAVFWCGLVTFIISVICES